MSIVVGGKLIQILNRITVFLVIFVNGLVRGEDCRPETLQKCVAPLTLISSIPGMAILGQRQELVEFCPQLLRSVICFRKYARGCMSLSQRDHLLKLFHGTQQVVRELCGEEGPLQHEFLRHSPCLKNVVEDYAQCSSNYHAALVQFEQQRAAVTNNHLDFDERSTGQSQAQVHPYRVNNHTSNLICCSFREYVSCSVSVVEKKCGSDTSRFTRKFMNQMAMPIMKEYREMCSKEQMCAYESSNATTTREFSVMYFGILAWALLAMLVKMVFLY